MNTVYVMESKYLVVNVNKAWMITQLNGSHLIEQVNRTVDTIMDINNEYCEYRILIVEVVLS